MKKITLSIFILFMFLSIFYFFTPNFKNETDLVGEIKKEDFNKVKEVELINQRVDLINSKLKKFEKRKQSEELKKEEFETKKNNYYLNYSVLDFSQFEEEIDLQNSIFKDDQNLKNYELENKPIVNKKIIITNIQTSDIITRIKYDEYEDFVNISLKLPYYEEDKIIKYTETNKCKKIKIQDNINLRCDDEEKRVYLFGDSIKMTLSILVDFKDDNKEKFFTNYEMKNNEFLIYNQLDENDNIYPRKEIDLSGWD